MTPGAFFLAALLALSCTGGASEPQVFQFALTDAPNARQQGSANDPVKVALFYDTHAEVAVRERERERDGPSHSRVWQENGTMGAGDAMGMCAFVCARRCYRAINMLSLAASAWLRRPPQHVGALLGRLLACSCTLQRPARPSGV